MMIKDMVMGPIIKLISDSYDLIKNRDRWTQDFYQKDQNGKNCPWRIGYSFCSVGAVHFIYHSQEESKKSNNAEVITFHKNSDNDYHYAMCLIQRFSEKLFNGKPIEQVNDDGNVTPDEAHRNILSVFEAILNKFHDREPTEEDWLEGLDHWRMKTN
jgi:hypothetical protein